MEVDQLMTVVPDVVRAKVAKVSHMEKPQPIVFDIVAWYEPSSHFKYTRGVRKAFEEMAREYTRSTLLLGRFGGRPVMQTDIQGIGVATRVEIGRLSLLKGHQQALIKGVFDMFRDCMGRELVSGPLERMAIHFSKADSRGSVRDSIRQAFSEAFGEECSFLAPDVDQPDYLLVGHSVDYQTLIQYLSEDSLYHSAHRGRIEKVSRHLNQEVGRYEKHRFHVAPVRADGGIPALSFCYTGEEPDRRVEAFMEGYTGERLSFVERDSFQAERHRYLGLKDYERASRRFGGLWILQSDMARFLSQLEVGSLYLFFDEDLRPEMGRVFTWEELFARQISSSRIDPASRNSQTFLETVLESLACKHFISEEGDGFRLDEDFGRYQHVTFYELGEFRKKQH